MTIMESLRCAINKTMAKVRTETDPAKLEHAIAKGERLCALHDRLTKHNGGRLSQRT